MNLDDLTIGQVKQLTTILGEQNAVKHPVFDGLVIAQFIGRFVFVCYLEIKGSYCYLTNVRNVRYWSIRENGLGDLANNGPQDDDKIDIWPDQIIPVDKLGPVMSINSEVWK